MPGENKWSKINNKLNIIKEYLSEIESLREKIESGYYVLTDGLDDLLLEEASSAISSLDDIKGDFEETSRIIDEIDAAKKFYENRK